VDLDFTFLDQEVFEGLSHKGIRKILSKKVNEIGELFEEVARKRNLDFKCDKGNRKYVELGGSNKFVTFKLWYPSIAELVTFIKIQINFLEKIVFPVKKVRLKSICPDSRELSFLFPEYYNEYRASIPFKVYDVREILCEKLELLRRETS